MKILIISNNAFSSTHNNGKTLESLFSGFDKESIAQLFFHQCDDPDYGYCDKYFRITDIDVVRKFIRTNVSCGQELSPVKNNLPADVGMFNSAKSKLKGLTLFRDMLWKTNVWKTNTLFQWLNDFNPNTIFFVGGGSGFSHEIAVFISKKLQIPLITYFTDDYIIYPRPRNFMDRCHKYRMEKFYRKTIKSSSSLFVIGDKMAEEYSKYFGKIFKPIMNTVEYQPYSIYNKRAKLTISYFGGLHLDRWKMILKLASFMNGVNFSVYSVTEPSEEILNAFTSAKIELKQSIQGTALEQAILNSDVLIHVESDDQYYRSLTKLSVSTKIPEYLISGRPILGFGPPEVASMKLLSDNDIGVVISSESSDETIMSDLTKILEDFEYRQNLGKRGYDFAINNFERSKVISDFTKSIMSV